MKKKILPILMVVILSVLSTLVINNKAHKKDNLELMVKIYTRGYRDCIQNIQQSIIMGDYHPEIAIEKWEQDSIEYRNGIKEILKIR